MRIENGEMVFDSLVLVDEHSNRSSRYPAPPEPEKQAELLALAEQVKRNTHHFIQQLASGDEMLTF